jgi:site-specific recombinase XerD
MKRKAADALPRLVESFFRDHLRCVRGASTHTVFAYRDSLRLFFEFLSETTRRPVSKLGLQDVDVRHVLAFLDHLESVRRNRVTTRNCRLAAIRCFTEHLLRHDPTRAAQYQRILVVPTKRTRTGPAAYLEPEEVEALLAQPDVRSRAGARDRALILFLYNTGARISEALAVSKKDVELARPASVRLHGKGAKDRICPLWHETAHAVSELIDDQDADDEPVFRSARGNPLTRDGVAYLLDKHRRTAAREIASLARRKVTPHVLRHSCAVALLQAGIDITTIRDYLGHVSVATTSRYITTNLRMKREVLEAFWKRAGLADRRSPKGRWRPSPGVLAFLASL